MIMIMKEINLFSLLVTSILISLRIQRVSAKDRYYHLVIEPQVSNAVSPDCQDLESNFRYLFLVRDALNPNSQIDSGMPGPTIEADEGDMLHIKVTNNNPLVATTIHWHGMYQRGTPFMDGTEGMTQCPLPPLSTQTYTFEASPAGTHFWHGHFGMQEADGLTGALIVHPKEPVLEYDEDVIVFLQDFYLQSSVAQNYALVSSPFVWIGNGNSILIGGKGIAQECLPAADGNSSETLPGCIDKCASDPLSQLTTIKVERGKVYLLRFIGATTLLMLNVAISGHNLTAVEIEGANIEPIDVQNINIGPGQRYALLLNATQPPGTYLLEATVVERNAPQLVGQAIIQYIDAPDEVQVQPTEKPYHPKWDDSRNAWIYGKTLKPESYPAYSALTVPEPEIKRYVLVTTQVHYPGEDGINRLGWAINNISFAFTPDEPLIGMAVKAAKKNGWPTTIPGTIDMPQNPPITWNYTLSAQSNSNVGDIGTSVIRANKDDVVEIILQNTWDLNGVSDVHQWHLHGHKFWVVGEGHGVFNPEIDPAIYNLENPVLRDTVNQWPLGWTAIRIKLDNPGVWFCHCHILSHLAMGMAFAVVVQADEIDDYYEEADSVQYDCMEGDAEAEPVEVEEAKSEAAAVLVSEVSTVFCLLSYFLLFG